MLDKVTHVSIKQQNEFCFMNQIEQIDNLPAASSLIEQYWYVDIDRLTFY